MTVNLEIKGQLAKLLATEDLIIENKKVDTAMFNVDTRVLTLPMWEKASNEVYDMLVGHEVGHALFTPNEDWDPKIPQQFLNVTEDARIEKMMKRKYAGLSKTFYKGYQQLHSDDFFSLEGEDVASMNLADRANLWFKIGNFIQVPIERGEETEIINMIADAETFEDAQKAAEALYNYCKKEKEQEKVDVDNQPEQTNSGASSVQETQQQQSEESQDSEEEQQNVPQSTNGGSAQSEKKDDGGDEQTSEEPEVKTDSNLSDKLKNLVDQRSQGNEYVEVPHLNLDTVVNSNKVIHDYIDDHFNLFLNGSENHEQSGNSKVFDYVDTNFQTFKKSAQKEVNYLVKEFECRKSADAYSRATTARTGILDTTKLHTYKYNEDLFKKVSIIPDGKNHGLIFILDWSGSMNEVIMDTLKQLYNLIWFCKKVSIPFRVYAFTYEFNCVTYDENGKAIMLKSHYEKKDGLLAVDDRFSLMEFFTSDVSGKEIERQMKNIWRCAYSLRWWTEYSCPHRLGLTGTPLNESLLCLHQIIPQFKNQHKLQKVQCVVLTDGEANHLTRHKEVKRHWESQPYLGNCQLTPNTYLRNRKTGKTYRVLKHWYDFTGTLLQNLKDEFPMVNFVGIRIIDRDGSNFIRRYCGWFGNAFDDAMKQWKKTKSVSIVGGGYQKYFGLSSTALAKNSEFHVHEDATKSQIKSAFVKSLNTKKLNKKILGEFVELIV